METAIRNLMFDVAAGREIYDEDRRISDAEANDKIREAFAEKLGLTKDSTEKQIKRALKTDAALEVFEIIEEIIDKQIAYGWKDNEFFNDFVETANLKDGDANEFYTKDDIILNVAKVSGDHHDLNKDRVRVA